MPAYSTPYVKNIIRRGLRTLVDPPPDKNGVQRIWQFFESKCAYCGRTLTRRNKEAHIDHLTPASQGGPNHISNRVLSCALCNESEKRDMDWDCFLKTKNPDSRTYKMRRKKILQWRRNNPPTRHVLDANVIADVAQLADQVVGHFEMAVQDIKRRYG